jgi:hypothetical protein
LYPARLVGGIICVKVDGFTVSEADTESFLDELVSLVLFGES